ncbi:nucleoside phosphorylase [Streptomyces sp. NPDC047049]|uniref:nucleoside phosphorylase n=1 Tax=Streptomyces sp. NPDC047049 TaxID=3156688 RepID=UPI0033C62CD4
MSGPSADGVPCFPGKYTVEALCDPAEHAAFIRSRYPGAGLSHTAGIVLLYQSSLARTALCHGGVRPLGRWVSADLHLTRDDVVLCSGFGRGAPAAGLIVEQLIALGAPAVVTIGTAATLTGGLAPGDLVVCREALRDEGLSRHYLPPARYTSPDGPLTARLTSEISALGFNARTGRTWTTDALYRETAAEVHQYAAEGVLMADMEAAGVLAVARYRQVPAAAAFAIADSLAQRTPRTDSPRTGMGLSALLDAATRTLIGTATGTVWCAR